MVWLHSAMNPFLLTFSQCSPFSLAKRPAPPPVVLPLPPAGRPPTPRVGVAAPTGLRPGPPALSGNAEIPSVLGAGSRRAPSHLLAPATAPAQTDSLSPPR